MYNNNDNNNTRVVIKNPRDCRGRGEGGGLNKIFLCRERGPATRVPVYRAIVLFNHHEFNDDRSKETVGIPYTYYDLVGDYS